MRNLPQEWSGIVGVTMDDDQGVDSQPTSLKSLALGFCVVVTGVGLVVMTDGWIITLGFVGACWMVATDGWPVLGYLERRYRRRQEEEQRRSAPPRP